MNMSIPMRNMPVQFINVQPLNPRISSCEIKVLYAGKNRNRSFIPKAVAEGPIASSLPNLPIVGEYLEHKKDFGDHAQEIVINDAGVKFVKRTVPFGAVPADTKVWWQWFHDDDGVDREYLMCQGYLWTGRFPEVTRVIEQGNGQSMEFVPESMKGEWATLQNEASEYFILDEAILDALCILGEDVEPCFQGANITAPNILHSLNKQPDFKQEMAQFMLDLKSALNSEEGGKNMPELDNIINPENTEVEAEVTIAEETIEETPGQNLETDESTDSTIVEPEFKAEEEEEEFAKKDEEEEEEASEDEEGEEDEDKKKSKYNLEDVVEYAALKVEFDALQVKYDALEVEYEGVKPELFSLRGMKTVADKKEKEAMIATFFMLDEEDLKDARDNIDKYSVSEIESKLSVIAVRKKVNFNLADSGKNEVKTEEPIISFSAHTHDNTPAWLKAVENVAKNQK